MELFHGFRGSHHRASRRRRGGSDLLERLGHSRGDRADVCRAESGAALALWNVVGTNDSGTNRRLVALTVWFAGTETRVRTLAFWDRGRFLDNIEFDLAGTPCEDVVRGGLCHHPRGVQQKFPKDRPLQEMGIESYLGVPLQDGSGRVLGHL